MREKSLKLQHDPTFIIFQKRLCFAAANETAIMKLASRGCSVWAETRGLEATAGVSGFGRLSPSLTLKCLHYENQMPNMKRGTQVTFKDRGRTSNTRPLTTFAAFSPCSSAEGSSCPTRSSSPASFRSILAQAARATRCAAVGVAKQGLTGAVRAEDERTAKGKPELRGYAQLLTRRHN